MPYYAEYKTQKYESDKKYIVQNQESGIQKITEYDQFQGTPIGSWSVAEYEFSKEAIVVTFYLGVDATKSPTRFTYLGEFKYNDGGLLNSATISSYAFQSSTGSLYAYKLNKPMLFSSLASFDEYIKNSTSKDGSTTDTSKFSKYFKENWYANPFGQNLLPNSNNSTGVVTATGITSAYDKYYSALTSGNASLISKQINWKELDISTATTDFYQALDWKSVNMSLLQKFQSSGINWSKVQYQEFSVTQYTQTNWSQVNTSQLTDSNYANIDWGRVAYKGTKSINYSQLSWSKVDFGDFSVATFKQVDWSQVKTSELTSEQYSEIKWGSVSFSGKTSINYSSLDWSQVITASGFNAAAYKSVNWGKVDFGDFKQQTFASTNWNQVNFKQLSASQYQAINWNEINLGALSTKTYKAIDWKKVDVAAFDADSIASAKWGLMKGVSKPTVSAKPAEADLSFLGVTAPAGTTAALVGAAGQSKSNQLIGALTGTKQGQVLPV